MNRWLKLVCFTLTCFTAPSETFAWNDAGHLTIARIAWDTLTEGDRIAVVTILREHPHLDALLLKNCPAEASQAEWIFLRTAVWADYIRPPKSIARDDVPTHPLHKFHRGPWHYVNFACTMGQAEDEMPTKPLANETNILEQLDLSMSVLSNSAAEDEGRVADLSDSQNRAVRMTWLFHLIGDLHQPLHCATLIDRTLFPDPPFSDQGGNKLAIRGDVQEMPKNLHWYWDGVFSTESDFAQIKRHAERLTHDPALSPALLAELERHPEFIQWAAESYQIAKTDVYLNGQLKLKRWEDFVTNQISANDVPVLSPTDAAQATKVAQRRVALAGYRLAAKLREIVAK